MALNHYTGRAAAVFRSRMPVMAAEFREQPDGSVYLELTSPSGCRFWISTQESEITVGFDAHHRHFGTPWDPDADGDVAEAVEYIMKLMSGQYLVAVWSRNEKFVQSETVGRGIDPRDLPRSWIGRWWLKGCSVEVRGW